MRHFVEYKMWGDETPFFIEDGGHFYKNGTMIGITKDDAYCYIPSDIPILKDQDVINRVRDMEQLDDNNNDMSLEAKELLANLWINDKNKKKDK